MTRATLLLSVSLLVACGVEGDPVPPAGVTAPDAATIGVEDS